MTRVIYIDVLICINIFINYFVLLAVVKFLNLQLKRIRLIFAATVGAVYSLFILLPPINFFLSLLLKLIMSITIILLAFGFLNLKLILKATCTFYLINFLFAGIIFFIWYFMSPKGIFMKNGMIYFNISPIFFIMATLVTYFIMQLCNKIIGQKGIHQNFCRLEIEQIGQKIALHAKIDTGNSLREPFSNTPVIIVDYNQIKNILPSEFNLYFSKHNETCTQPDSSLTLKMRLIPFKTISGNGLLPAFKPEKITIIQNKYSFVKEAFIAVADERMVGESFSALVSPELID
ncbi:MAG: Sporulation sigma-E factor-processing peptidase [Eubacteriales bacterium SKADARSKE-1]|nr:Sporulation sigma-E factor-processing peptidase [Eubacteriales bacterium SKADARSKE-1]